MREFRAPREGILLTHFIVSGDAERSRRFYTNVLGGETVLAGEPSIVALANGWIIIDQGGGPTDDKPTVTLETPPDPGSLRPGSDNGRDCIETWVLLRFGRGVSHSPRSESVRVGHGRCRLGRWLHGLGVDGVRVFGWSNDR